MQKRSVLEIESAESTTKDEMKKCIEFLCGLEIEDLEHSGNSYRAYLSTTDYNGEEIIETLEQTDHVETCEQVI